MPSESWPFHDNKEFPKKSNQKIDMEKGIKFNKNMVLNKVLIFTLFIWYSCAILESYNLTIGRKHVFFIFAQVLVSDMYP